MSAFIYRGSKEARKEQAGSGARWSDGHNWQQRSEVKSQADGQKPGDPGIESKTSEAKNQRQEPKSGSKSKVKSREVLPGIKNQKSDPETGNTEQEQGPGSRTRTRNKDQDQ
ncbi:Hypothetical predicted protein, partial [Pelobates cultripes]